MAWNTILEKEQIEIRCDNINKNVVIEVNSGGLVSEYITLHLDEKETEELIDSLIIAKDRVFNGK